MLVTHKGMTNSEWIHKHAAANITVWIPRLTEGGIITAPESIIKKQYGPIGPT